MLRTKLLPEMERLESQMHEAAAAEGADDEDLGMLHDDLQKLVSPRPMPALARVVAHHAARTPFNARPQMALLRFDAVWPDGGNEKFWYPCEGGSITGDTAAAQASAISMALDHGSGLA